MKSTLVSPLRSCFCLPYTVLALMLGAGPLQAAILSDDFNDGNITGWSIHNPLATFFSTPQEAFATSFPVVGKVQLESGSSPDLANLGPGRGAIYRNDLPQTGAHRLSVDFSSFDMSNQFFGLAARIRQVGLGTLDAYSLTYSPEWYSNTPRARFAIDRIDNEQPIELIEYRFDGLPVDGNYRLQFSLNGNQLTGVLTDLLDPLNPISTLSATDSAYTQGLAGLFVAGSEINNITTLVNFDNFSIEAIPEPSTWALILAGSCVCVVWYRKNPAKPADGEMIAANRL